MNVHCTLLIILLSPSTNTGVIELETQTITQETFNFFFFGNQRFRVTEGKYQTIFSFVLLPLKMFLRFH